MNSINWEFSFDKQTGLYTHCLETLVYGNLGRNRFYLLDQMPPKFRDRVIFVPCREIAKRVVKRIKDNDKTLLNREDEMVIQTEVENLYKSHKLQLDKLERDFGQTVDNVSQQLETAFPNINDVEINICPQMVGTLGDYSLSDKVIEVHPRYDRKIVNVYHLVVNALTHYFYYRGETLSLDNDRWREKQTKTLQIFQELDLGDLGNSKGMLDILDSEHVGRLAQESAKYYKYLSIPIPSETDRIDPSTLSSSEKKLYMLLKRNRNQMVTLDTIAETIWAAAADEKYSLYAISKLIERLNKKFKEQGIEVRLIHSERGEGYVLFD